MGRKARETVKKYTWEKTSRNILDIFERVVEK